MMKYRNVFIESFGYELAPCVVTTADIEEKLAPFFEAVGFEKGQLEALTGIRERRFWEAGDHTMGQHAAVAGQRAMDEGGVGPEDIGALAFCGVCRDGFEPATSCSVAARLNLGRDAHIYDVSSACLGMITGLVHIANEIELGNIRAGLVVSCETARQIVDATIQEINEKKNIEFYKETVATMTGGSGACAILLTDGTLGNRGRRGHQVLGGVVQNSIQHYDLCHWGFETGGMPTDSRVIMRTNAQGVLENGVELVVHTFNIFRDRFDLTADQPDKIIGHQVGAVHHQHFYRALGLDMKKDFSTFPFLGNVGTVSLPITAAVADERGFLESGDFVAFIGVGSGLNCYILGIDW